MSEVMLTIGSLSLYKSALVIAFGAAACFALFYALYSAHGGLGAAAWLFAAADIVLSVLFCRFLHYYCHSEQYPSFWQAMTRYSTGGYVLAGLVPAALCAGWLVKLAGLTGNPGRLFDCFAPGALLGCAMIRLSALFNTTCRGKIAVKTPLLQHLPLASPATMSSGASDWRFASFFVEFLLLMGAAYLTLRFFYRRRRQSMKGDLTRDGNVALFALMLLGAAEVVIDSTRYDSSFLPFNGFVSLGQIVAGLCLLAPQIVWSVRSVRVNGRSGFHWAIWVLWFVCLAAAGGLEFLVQRRGHWYLLCYTGMSLAVCGIVQLNLAMFKSLWAKKKRKSAA